MERAITNIYCYASLDRLILHPFEILSESTSEWKKKLWQFLKIGPGFSLNDRSHAIMKINHIGSCWNRGRQVFSQNYSSCWRCPWFLVASITFHLNCWGRTYTSLSNLHFQLMTHMYALSRHCQMSVPSVWAINLLAHRAISKPA